MQSDLDICLICHFLCLSLELNNERATNSRPLIKHLDGPERNTHRTQRLVCSLLDRPSRVNEMEKEYREARNWDLSRVYILKSSLSLVDRMRFTNWLPNRFMVDAIRETLTKSVPIPKIIFVCCNKARMLNQGFVR